MTNAAAPTPGDAREMSEKLFGRAILLSMALGFVILAGVVAMTGWLLVRSTEFSEAVDHTYAVETEIADFQVMIERAEAARRGFLLAGVGAYMETYRESADSLRPVLARMRRLTADNPNQQRRLDELDRLVARKVQLMENSIADRRAIGVESGAAAFQRPEEQQLLDRIRLLGAEMNTAEQNLLVQRNARQTANGRLLLTVVVLAGVVLGLLAFGSTWVMRRFAGDLTRSRAALRRLNEGLEEAVRDRTADLTRANDEIQRFAYIVSHDLRAPLVNIMGFTSELEAASKPLRKLVDEVSTRTPELVSKEASDAVELDLPESIGFIRSSTQKMDRLISAILRLSREGRRSLHPEPLDMDTVIDGVLQSMRRQADDKGAVVQVEGKLPQIVSDRVAVEQVFSNLVENAVKYLKPGRPGVVKIRGREDGGRVLFEIEDNGRGVDPRDHERIFDLFRRAGAQDQPGEGIGLAHVRALTYRLGGLIDCVSALDQGATFRLSLPRILAREIGGSSVNDHLPVTIVMIEDDEGHARLIERNVRRAGINNRVRHFLDGTSALDFLFNHADGPALNGPALILLDLNLPDMSGTDILTRIKADPKLRRTPVVVLTTTDDKVEIQRCYDLGCNVYITKPVDYEAFADAIRQLGLFLAVIQVPDPEIKP